MSLAALFAGMSEVRGALTGDREGHVLEATEDAAAVAEQEAATTALAASALDAAGEALGLGPLSSLQVRSSTRATLTGVAPHGFLFVAVDPIRRTAEVEKRLAGWEGPGPEPVSPVDALPLTGPMPAGEAAPEAPAADAPARPAGERDPFPAPPPGTATNLAPVSAGGAPPRDDPWAALRRALVRGHLSEAVARLKAVAEAPPAATPRPGSEPLLVEELGLVMQRMLEGIGSVLAGDTLGGTRTLRELAGPGQRNASIRWVALYWLSRAALGGSGLEAARAQVEEALALSRQLDVEARAFSQLVAAELLSRAGKHDKALTWISEARSRFERVGDGWGRGQAWLVEARLQAALGQDQACEAAAARAQETDTAWDGPPIFLAGRALGRGDLAAAAGLLAGVDTPAATRMRRLVAAVGDGLVSVPDAAEFLRLHHAAPTAQAIRALERIADAAPRFYQAREALAWMLVKLGKYASAHELLAWLAAQPLESEDRAVVQLGLSTVEAAQAAGGQAGPQGAAAAPGGQAPARLTDSVLLTQAGGGTGAADSVFSGRLSVFSLPDLVEFLRSARRTGQLVCSSPAGLGVMHFRKGFITGAASPATPSACELLVRSGAITAETAGEIGPEGMRPGLGACDVLVKRGLADAAVVQQALRQQIELTLRELLRWNDGEFAFSQEAGADPVSPALAVQVDAQELLLTLFKEMDEASRGATGA